MKKLLLSYYLVIHISVVSFGSLPDLIKCAGDAGRYPYNLLVVFDSTRVHVQETGLTLVYSHTLTKVLTQKGAVEQSVIKSGYDPQSAFVEFRKVVIYKKDGQVIILDTGKTMDYPAPARAIYWGAREIMMEVGKLEPGDAVEVEMFRKGFTYALLMDDDDRYIPPMRGHFYDIVEFFGQYPVKNKVYSVSISPDKKLQFKFYNGEVETSCHLEKDQLVYTFSKTEILPIKTESRMVALSDVAPKLLLSTSPDWFAKSRWFYRVNEDFKSFSSTPEIDAKVAEILNGANDEMDSISRLTHWCADEIRYSGISMGIGEGFTLHKGEMNFRDRCGVCKDKAGMLITMLRAAGFQSYPAMTMAGSRIDLIPADQFNHCVTVVRLKNGKLHLLDPTWVPFLRELWSSAEQQQQYLMGIPEGSDLATTPVSDPQNHFLKINGVSQLHTDGSLTGRITITGEGQSDAAVRGIFRGMNPAYWYQGVEKELLRIWPQAKVTQIKYNNPIDYQKEPMWVGIDYQIQDFAIVSGKSVVFTPLTAAQIFKSFQGHLLFDSNLKERKYPFRDRCSRLVEIDESITLPEKAKMKRLPTSVAAGGESASYKGSYELKTDVLVFRATARYGKRIYQPSEWPEIKASVEAQDRFSTLPVIIEMN